MRPELGRMGPSSNVIAVLTNRMPHEKKISQGDLGRRQPSTSQEESMGADASLRFLTYWIFKTDSVNLSRPVCATLLWQP